MSFSSRLTNIIGSYVPALGRAGTRHQVEQYRSSNGKKGSKFLGCPCFLLDVVGRRSGESHPVMLIHVPRGDDLIDVHGAPDSSGGAQASGSLIRWSGICRK
jgi:hypothetical protein